MDKQLKSEWKILSTRTINKIYVTDISQWICGCPFYLINRFCICKHLVQQKGLVTPEFFQHLKRNNQPPFLTEMDQDFIDMQANLFYNAYNNNTDVQDSDNSIEDCDAIYN